MGFCLLWKNNEYKNEKEEGERITIPDGASYDVEASQDGINILPKRGTDLGGEDVPVSDKKKMILEPIVAEGEGRVCVYAVLHGGVAARRFCYNKCCFKGGCIQCSNKSFY